jgi:hypothetical protein
VSHRLQALAGRRRRGGAPEGLEQLLAGALAGGQEQLLLGAEQAEQVRLRSRAISAVEVPLNPLAAKCSIAI